MSGWLTAWVQPLPSASGGHDMWSMGSSMGGDEMEGMMATTQSADGQNPEAKTLARQIISAQKKEIDAMERMLPTISG